MASKRRRFTPEQKVVLLKRHLLEAVPVSDLCDEAGIAPNLFYRWQKEFFENGQRAFETSRRAVRADRQVAELRERIARKDEVIAELMEEHVALKKKSGGR